MIATGVMIGRAPSAIEAGAGSPAAATLVSAMVAAVALLAASQMLGPARLVLGELLARRVDGAVRDRLMRAAARGPGIAALEDRALVDRLGEAAGALADYGQTPRKAVAGLA